MIGLLKNPLPISLKENSKRTSGNSLSPLGAPAEIKNIGATSQTLLTGVR